MKIVVSGGQATRYVARYFIARQTRFAGRVLFLATAIVLLAPVVVVRDTIAPGGEGIGSLRP